MGVPSRSFGGYPSSRRAPKRHHQRGVMKMLRAFVEQEVKLVSSMINGVVYVCILFEGEACEQERAGLGRANVTRANFTGRRTVSSRPNFLCGKPLNPKNAVLSRTVI